MALPLRKDFFCGFPQSKTKQVSSFSFFKYPHFIAQFPHIEFHLPSVLKILHLHCYRSYSLLYILIMICSVQHKFILNIRFTNTKGIFATLNCLFLNAIFCILISLIFSIFYPHINCVRGEISTDCTLVTSLYRLYYYVYIIRYISVYMFKLDIYLYYLCIRTHDVYTLRAA